MTLIRFAYGLAFAALAAAPLHAETPPLPQETLTAIGKINVAGFDERRQCSGVLVGPRQVLTAAHCLLRGRSDRPVAPSSIHFLAGAYAGGGYLAHGVGACVRFQPELAEGWSLSFDAAIIVLSEDIDAAPLKLADTIDENWLYIAAAYSEPRRHALTVQRPCATWDRLDGLYLSDCKINFGASGGALLLEADYAARGGGQVAGVLVGKLDSGQALAVPVDHWRDLVSGPSCP